MSLRQWSAVARFGGPGVVLGLALAWSIGGQRGVHAQGSLPARPDRPLPVAPSPVGESGGTLAMISALPGGNGATGQLLYLIDTKSRAFAVYRIDPTHTKGTIKLEGVRQYHHWDMKLAEFRNQEPDVLSIESAVKAAGSQTR